MAKLDGVSSLIHSYSMRKWTVHNSSFPNFMKESEKWWEKTRSTPNSDQNDLPQIIREIHAQNGLALLNQTGGNSNDSNNIEEIADQFFYVGDSHATLARVQVICPRCRDTWA